MVLWGAFEIGEPWKPTLTHEPISTERKISSEGKSERRPQGPLPGSGTWRRVFFGELGDYPGGLSSSEEAVFVFGGKEG